MGQVDETFIVQETRSLKTRQAAVERRLKEIATQRLQLANLNDAEANMNEFCRSVSGKLANMTFEHKRLALETSGAQVCVFPDRV